MYLEESIAYFKSNTSTKEWQWFCTAFYLYNNCHIISPAYEPVKYDTAVRIGRQQHEFVLREDEKELQSATEMFRNKKKME